MEGQIDETLSYSRAEIISWAKNNASAMKPDSDRPFIAGNPDLWRDLVAALNNEPLKPDHAHPGSK